ncbi:hypothetical protein CAPTEDRAFT_41215, partial [Capitella teleta]
LKKSSVKIAHILMCAINRSFDEGKVPNDLKISIVVPVYKEGDPMELANYRPEIVSSCLSEIFEQLMYQQIVDFLEANEVL